MEKDLVVVDESSTATVAMDVEDGASGQHAVVKEPAQVSAHTPPPAPSPARPAVTAVTDAAVEEQSHAVSAAPVVDVPHAAIPATTTSRERSVGRAAHAPALVPFMVEEKPAQDAVTVKRADDERAAEATLRAFIATWSASLGGVCPGMLVFAPHRVGPSRTGSAGTNATAHSPTTTGGTAHNHGNGILSPPVKLHYALAEVTGLQRCAGTATVTFLMTDPGVDDEAIPLFELIPCPSAWLSRLGVDAMSPQHDYCTLLERVLAVGPADGPVHADAALAQLVSAGAPTRVTSTAERSQPPPLFALEDLYCLAKNDQPVEPTPPSHTSAAPPATAAVTAPSLEPGGEEPWAPARKAAKLEAELGARGGGRGRGDHLGATSSSAGDDADDAVLLHRRHVGSDKEALVFSFEAPQSVHTFFATAFHVVDHAVEVQRRLWQSQQAQQDAASMAAPAQVSDKAMRRALWQPRKPIVVLCVFDGYSILHRFEVYMSLRGHVVRLLDGEDGQSEMEVTAADESGTSGDGGTAGRKVCQGPTPVPPVEIAFGSACKVWLCMMRDDATAGGAVGSGSPSLPKLLAKAPPIDIVVTFRETSEQEEAAREASVAVSPDGTHEEQARLARAIADKDGADAAVHRLLPHLHASRGRQLYCCFDHLPPEHGAAGKVVKVSGSLFGANKVLVPASREQLLLAATVWASANHAAAAGGAGLVPPSAGHGRGSGSGDPAAAAAASSSVLSAALLERIALGTFTDSSAANLFTTYQRTVAFTAASPGSPTSVPSPHDKSGPPPRVVRFSAIRDLRDAFYRDASQFGSVFPIFAAARALVEDVFADWQHQRSSRAFPSRREAPRVKREPDEDDLGSDVDTKKVRVEPPPRRSPFPRIALVFPRGNPTGNPLLTVRQFLHNLRQYLAPWMLYEVALPCDTAQTAVPVLWHQRGGVLLLHSDESSAQLGALHHEADVVIACGKAAAAWVAANAVAPAPRGVSPSAHDPVRAPLHFAVMSEVEVVADVTTHVWVPYEPVDVSRDDCSSSLGMRLLDGRAEDALSRKVAQGEAEKAWRQLQTMVAAIHSTEVTLPSQTAGRVGAEGGRRRRRNSSASGGVGGGTSPSSPSVTMPGAGASANNSTPAQGAGAARMAQECAAMPKLIQQAVLLHQHLDRLAQDVSQGQDGGLTSAADGLRGGWAHAKAFSKALALNAAATLPVTLGDIQVGTV